MKGDDIEKQLDASIRRVQLTEEQRAGLHTGDSPVAMPIPGDGIPRAVIHPDRHWLRTFALALIPAIAVAVCAGFGTLLNRINAAQVEARTAIASAANAYAHVLALRAEVDALRVPPAAVDALCRERTQAIRDALLVLQRVGKVEFEAFPGMRWRSWTEDGR